MSRIMSHMTMLDEDTDPSFNPVKKKYSTISERMASKPQSIQNNIIVCVLSVKSNYLTNLMILCDCSKKNIDRRIIGLN